MILPLLGERARVRANFLGFLIGYFLLLSGFSFGFSRSLRRLLIGCCWLAGGWLVAVLAFVPALFVLAGGLPRRAPKPWSRLLVLLVDWLVPAPAPPRLPRP